MGSESSCTAVYLSGEVPNLVSYHIGRDNRTTSDTRLTYMTTGVLLRKLIRLGTLRGYTHIILDEVSTQRLHSHYTGRGEDSEATLTLYWTR